MPITSSAKKTLRSSKRKHVFNLRRTRTMRVALKEIRDLVGKGAVADARNLLSKAYQAIDKAAKRGVIKANTASRKKSRLTQFIKKAGSK